MSAMASVNLRRIPQDIHDRFKAACAHRGRTMRDMVRAFMQDAVLTSATDNRRPIGPAVNLAKLSNRYPKRAR